MNMYACVYVCVYIYIYIYIRMCDRDPNMVHIQFRDGQVQSETRSDPFGGS